MIERRRQLPNPLSGAVCGVPGVTMFGEPSGADGGPTRDNFWLSSILINPAVAGFAAETSALRLPPTTSSLGRYGSRWTCSRFTERPKLSDE